MYKNLQVIKANLLPILLGTAVGSLSCVLMIAVFCRIFGLSEIIQLSMLSKSTTIPIAIPQANDVKYLHIINFPLNFSVLNIKYKGILIRTVYTTKQTQSFFNTFIHYFIFI